MSKYSNYVLWKPVVGFEGIYEVSNFGHVRSLPRVSHAGRDIRAVNLRPSRDKHGYARVALQDDWEVTHKKVAVLVLEAFDEPRPEGMHSCHNDGDPTNDHISNLRWDTPSGNHLDKVKHGTHPQARRTHCPRGHALTHPNLVPSGVQRGKRSCLACSREYSAARTQGREFSAERADERHAQIIGGSKRAA